MRAFRNGGLRFIGDLQTLTRQTLSAGPHCQIFNIDSAAAGSSLDEPVRKLSANCRGGWSVGLTG
jgi:hypothetical protein